MKPKIVQISAVDVSMNNMLSLLNKRTKEAGFEVHCICSPGKNTQEIIEAGYYFHPVKIDRNISIRRNLKSVYNIYKVLKRVKPDIVHVHTPIASVLGRIAAKLAKVDNIIYTAHGFYFHEGMNPKTYTFFYNIEKYIGKFFTDYLFSQSREDYDLAKRGQFLKHENNYLHISNGVDLRKKFNYNLFHNDINNKIRAKYGVEDEGLLITFMGRLVKEKGILDLVQAISELNDTSIKLLALGDLPDSERDKSLTDELLKLEKENNNITFVGRVSNVEDFLYASDIFSLPSYREGMPRSIIEAMAMKNAIIATNIRGSREEVDDGENGYLINVNSPTEIKEKLNYLNRNRKTLAKMQKASYEKANALYDEENVVSKQIEIFKRLISGDIHV